LREDPQMSALYPAKCPVEVAIHLRGGRILTRRLDEVKWSPESPPRFTEIAEKFRMCAAPVIGAARTERAIAMVDAMRPSDRLPPLFATLRRRRASRTTG